jgi:hypothetical protein
MSPRYDVFRKEGQNFIKWVGTAEHFEEAEKLIRTDRIRANASDDDYLVVYSSLGVTEAVTKPFAIEIHAEQSQPLRS